jgi:Flp pilus assembly protein TadG
MGTKVALWNRILDRLCFPRQLGSRSTAKGQAMVEFTLVFILLLVVAWIPADFGLAFYTGQLALNASREGTRIAAADPCLLGTNATAGCVIGGIVAQTGTCTLGVDCGGTPGSIMAETAERLSSALLPGATVTVTYPVPGGSTCNQQVRVQVSGNYNFFFYRILRLFAGNAATPTNNYINIVRSTDMRWEHQSPCMIGS